MKYRMRLEIYIICDIFLVYADINFIIKCIHIKNLCSKGLHYIKTYSLNKYNNTIK